MKPARQALGYVIACIAVAVTFGVRMLLTAWFGPGLPVYAIFFPAVVLVTLMAGWGPGLLAVSLTVWLVYVWLVPPAGHLSPGQPVDQIGALLFIVTAAFIIACAEHYRRALRRESASAIEAGQTALQASEERLSLAQCWAGIGMWEWNPQTGELHSSQELHELYGMAPGTLGTYGQWRACVHPDDIGHVEADTQLALLERRPFEHEFRIMRPSGEIRWLACKGKASYGPNGETLRVTRVCIDITERKRTEEALTTANDRFELAIRNSNIVLFHQDRDLRYTWLCNPTLGRTSEEILGKNDRELFEKIEDALAIEAIKREVIRTGISQNREVRVHRNGADWYYDLHVEPLRSADGSIAGIGCAAVDISDRKQADAALRSSEQRTRLAIEATHVGIWEWNVRTGTIHWDTEMFRIYGIPPTEDGIVDYSQWIQAVAPEERATNEAILQDTLQRRGRSARMFRIQRQSDRQWRHIESVETVRQDDRGQVECVVGTNLDVTTRTETEAALQQLAAQRAEESRRKDEFLATLAHELRNPLAPLRNAVRILQVEDVDVATSQWAKEVIERQVAAMTRLIDDLLDMNRINQGKVELKREHVMLSDVVQSAVEASRPLIEQMKHTLSIATPQEKVIVDADETRLVQILLNLLNNAAKYTEPGGRIDLRVERSGGDVQFAVRDSGIGIAADKLHTIFEMFSQVEGALSRSQGGLGIGLSIVKRLVEMHGGTVEARSPGIGQGSEFVVCLPIVVTQHDAADSEGVAPDTGAASGLRILVVDDNQDAADSLAMLLSMKGHEVRTTYDGPSAVSMATEFRPEVVLCDIGLPVVSGYDTCGRIRAQPGGADMVLVAVTGWGQDDDRRRSREAGFDHHLVKPLDLDALTRLLAGVAALSRGRGEEGSLKRTATTRPPSSEAGVRDCAEAPN